MRIAHLSLAILAMSCASVALAQTPITCTDESVARIPARWQKIVQPSVDLDTSPHIPKSELPKLRAQMESYVEVLRRALGDLNGYHVRWYSSSGPLLYRSGPASYFLHAPMYPLECVNGLAKAGTDEREHVSIEVNGMWHLYGGRHAPRVRGRNYQVIGSPLGEVRGFPVFETSWQGVPGAQRIRQVLLVHKPGKRPFRFATRKELLEALTAANEEARADSLAKYEKYYRIRPKAEQEQERAKELALFLKGARDEQQKQRWTERFDKDYRTDEQKHEEQIRKFNAVYDKNRAHFDKLLAAQTPAQLDEIAYADGFDADDRFQFTPPKSAVCPKTECSEHLGKPLAIPVRSYYDETLPRSSPQLILVSFELLATAVRRNGEYFVENPPLEKMRDEFFARLDFDRLVSMIGK